MRMIEFFSGIGGMRFALEQALENHARRYDYDDHDCKLSSCQAYDISLHANKVYEHNFQNESSCSSSSKVSTKLVEQLKKSDVDGKADIWTMSPPCQPFTKTRGSKGLDADDNRCAGLKGLIRLLSEIQDKPRYIFLENVQGFRNSRMIEQWKQCLRDNGYRWKSYLVSPISLGIPNHRLRFYMLCERCRSCDRSTNEDACDQMDDDTLTSFSSASSSRDVKMQTVSNHLRPNETENGGVDLSGYIVPESILIKPFAKDLGIVSGKDTQTHCFTAGYGRVYHRSTGSILLMDTIYCKNSKAANENVTAAVADEPIDRSDMAKYVGRLRRFTPQELLTLFGFPRGFRFGDIPLQHKYKLVGNSINVTVVTELLTELLFGGSQSYEDVGAKREKDGGQKDEIANHRTKTTMIVGGEMGHIEEKIDGNLLDLYNFYRWKMIKNCTGRYTCRDHDVVSTFSPVELIENAGVFALDNNQKEGWNWQQFELRIERKDKIIVVPLDREKTVGLITFVKEKFDDDGSEPKVISYVHTLNTPSGFRRKLIDMGVTVSTEQIYLPRHETIL